MFSSKVRYSFLILLLAVVVMFYSTALPFSAAVEPEYEYVPVTLTIDDIASLVLRYAHLSSYTGTLNSTDFVLYTSGMSLVQEDVTMSLGNPLLFSTPYLDYERDLVCFFPQDLNTAFTIDRGTSVFFESSLYIPFDYYIGPDTEFSVITYFQSVLSDSGPIAIPYNLDVYLMYDVGNHFGEKIYGSTYIDTMALPLSSDPLSSRLLLNVVPTDIYNTRDVVRYICDFTPNWWLYESDYIGGIPSAYEGLYDEVYLTFFFYVDLYNYELDSEVFFPCLCLKPFTIYVKQEIAPTVERFLDAITDPSPESKAEVERLEQELEDISEQLREDASDLEVEKPDVSDNVDNLPSEVIDGMGDASENILSPLMTLDLIATLFSVLFGVVALKLILFGSGTS